MSFLRSVPKNPLNRSVLCICFSRDVWQNPNRMAIGVDIKLSNRTFSRTSFTAKKISDYYRALGVSKRATAQEIKDAYYELSKKYHPDKNKGSDMASERFREIKEAYEVLGNQGKKRKYDRVVFSSSGAKTERMGNEIVIQNTDAFSRHMARYSTPMGERPTAQAMDKCLSDRSSDMFKEKQKLFSQRSELDESSSNNMLIILFSFAFFGVIAIYIKSSNEKRYEEILRKYKYAKSK